MGSMHTAPLLCAHHWADSAHSAPSRVTWHPSPSNEADLCRELYEMQHLVGLLVSGPAGDSKQIKLFQGEAACQRAVRTAGLVSIVVLQVTSLVP